MRVGARKNGLDFGRVEIQFFSPTVIRNAEFSAVRGLYICIARVGEEKRRRLLVESPTYLGLTLFA